MRMVKHAHRKKKILLVFLLIFGGVIICLVEIFSKQTYERALDAIGAGRIRRQGTYSWDGMDKHGFLGDGFSYFIFHLSNKKQMEEVLKEEGWHSFPMDERIIEEIDGVLMYVENNTPETDRKDILTELKQISEGGWFFYDKADVESLKNMDLEWTFHHGRRLTNYIIAVYDSGAGIIYYFDCDR